jgi:flagellar basal-body rod modification protein FlgD
MVGSVSNSTNLTVQPASVDASTKLTQDYTTFLKLLTTQLQNQDPLEPMDSAQFTQQLVQYSAVEQQISSNKKLDSLISLQNNNSAGSALGYLGKEVEISGNGMNVTGNGGKFSYEMVSKPDTISITVKDSQGQPVRTFTPKPADGKQIVTWDGKDDYGNVKPNGTYTFDVTATSKDGSKVTSKTISTYNIVDGVESGANGAQITMGNLRAMTDKILTIRDTVKATTTTQGNA